MSMCQTPRLCAFALCLTVALAAKPTTTSLTAPFSAVDDVTLQQFGVDEVTDAVAFWNSDISYGQYQTRRGYKWSPSVVNSIDGVVVSNFGDYTSYANHLRNLIQPNSVVVTTSPNTTVLSDYVVKYAFCVKMTLEVGVGSFSANTDITKCAQRTLTFDESMDFVRLEMSSDSKIAGVLLSAAMYTTTLAPGTFANAVSSGSIAADDTMGQLRSLLTNPVFVSAIAIVSLVSLAIAVLVYLVLRKVMGSVKSKKIRDYETAALDSEMSTESENCMSGAESAQEKDRLVM